MKKKIGNLLLMAGLVSSLTLPVMAKDLSGTVTFTKNEEMDYNDPDKKLLGNIADMQPGDSTTIQMRVVNDFSKPTNWYLSNEVVQSLQEADAERTLGGGYEYRLTDEGPTGSRTLYESKSLGGQGQAGLMEAAEGLEDYVFLDTLNNNQSGVVSLEIALDGETQGNDYQETMAEVAMQFATEVSDTEPKREADRVIHTTKKNRIVNTSTLTNRLPWLLVSGISGALLLILALFGIKERKKEED